MDILQGYLGNRKNLIAPRSIANDTVLHQERLHQLNLVFFTLVEHQEQQEQQEQQSVCVTESDGVCLSV